MTRMQEGTILSTQAQEGGDGGAGREWRKFQHSSRQSKLEVAAGVGGWGAEEGEEAGATVKSQAKTPKIERHFHMYILQMYIDTIR